MQTKWIVLPMLAALIASAGCQAASNQPVTIGQSNPSTSLNWVRYTDNAEGAFSMEVPVGWQDLGGMYRFGYFDVRWMMDVRSLDGKVIIRMNDVNVPPYVLPGPHSGPAGHAAIRQNLFQMVVDNYREAQAYAESYAKRRFSSTCTSMTPRPADWTPTMPEDWQNEPGARSSQASIAYDCQTSDGPRVVNVYARSSIHGKDGLWTVDPIISIISAPDKLAQAHSMTQRMIESWQETPQWRAYQVAMTQKGLSQIGEEFGQFMHQMQIYHQQREAAMNQQVAKFEARQQAQADQVSSWGNILTGVTNLYDSTTGTKFQVFSGPKSNYYVNGNGVTINSNLSPGPSFHQAENVGP